MHNFFNTKLQRYAGNPKALNALQGVLKAIEEKKQRFLGLVELSKSPEQMIDFATLKPEIMQVVAQQPQVTPLVRLQGQQMLSHIAKHPETDLFDYYLAQDILQEPLSIYKNKDEKNPKNYIFGVKLGRWY